MLGLKYALCVKGIQQKTLQELFDIKNQTIQCWLTGKRKIPEKYHEQLENLLGVEIEFLIKQIDNDDKILFLQKEIKQLTLK